MRVIWVDFFKSEKDFFSELFGEIPFILTMYFARSALEISLFGLNAFVLSSFPSSFNSLAILLIQCLVRSSYGVIDCFFCSSMPGFFIVSIFNAGCFFE